MAGPMLAQGGKTQAFNGTEMDNSETEIKFLGRCTGQLLGDEIRNHCTGTELQIFKQWSKYNTEIVTGPNMLLATREL